ncbi:MULTISPECIES: hypothetical protein [Campylobacter]|uniref:hypothetical protein n=1 Tax=Campylobacter TaxID=194 RepID=UPI00112FB82B|nr:hypothetical protein [Campylobacter sp. P0024]MCR8678913.1 hypothetical protein [Campylobacter sp. RM19072]
MRLSDKLALEYLKFRNQCEFDLRCIEALLRYFKGEFIFTKEQLSYASKEIASFDMSRFLPLLDKIPKFRLILCDDNDKFPNVNIFSDRIENNLSATFKKDDPRDKAIEHFKALFKDAKSIFIYDNYLYENHNLASLEKFIEECKIQCNIYLDRNTYNKIKTNKNLSPKIKYKIAIDKAHNLNNKNTHDRYIMIDNNIEIILTSGIDYLFDTSKDFTYIIREI